MLKIERPKIALCGGRWLAAELLRNLSEEGYQLCLVTQDETGAAARRARELGICWTARAEGEPPLKADFAWQPDLIISAHSFRIIPAPILSWSRLGGIGFHPSLLPEFKGRNAVADCMAAGISVTGGSVYWLTSAIDDGAVVAARGRRYQQEVFIRPGETAADLWRRALAPLGLSMLTSAASSLLR
jgi:methionyl-tRNA formyltransferase